MHPKTKLKRDIFQNSECLQDQQESSFRFQPGYPYQMNYAGGKAAFFFPFCNILKVLVVGKIDLEWGAVMMTSHVPGLSLRPYKPTSIGKRRDCFKTCSPGRRPAHDSL